MDISSKICSIKNELKENDILIAVTKTRNIEEMMIAYKSGVKEFGENKVQELLKKYESIPSDVKWHIIGKLQRNKVKYIVGKVHLIQSLDSVSLLEELEKQYAKAGQVANTLIQINIGREESKSGILIENLNELIKSVELCSFVKVLGIMAIIPKGNDIQCREHFNEVKGIFKDIKNENYKNIQMEYLSIGMSNDYKIALQCGSNMIRVGQGIFGERRY